MNNDFISRPLSIQISSKCMRIQKSKDIALAVSFFILYISLNIEFKYLV